MKEEINEEIKQLLDSLEEHGRNVRRQKELNDLIDQLAKDENVNGTPRKRRKPALIWLAMGAAAACLLGWILVIPTIRTNPETNKKILVEKTENADSIKTEANVIVFEASKIIAKETPVVPQKAQTKKVLPKIEIKKETSERPILAEVAPTEPKDTINIGSNTIPTVYGTPIAVQSPRRRVIRSLNLVCYECQNEAEPEPKINLEDKTLFGQPQDPNMRNGALAFEIKLK